MINRINPRTFHRNPSNMPVLHPRGNLLQDGLAAQGFTGFGGGEFASTLSGYVAWMARTERLGSRWYVTSQHDFLDSLVKVQFLSILLICVDGLCHQSHLEELQGSSLLNWLHHKPLMWIDGLYNS